MAGNPSPRMVAAMRDLLSAPTSDPTSLYAACHRQGITPHAGYRSRLYRLYRDGKLTDLRAALDALEAKQAARPAKKQPRKR